MLADNLLNGFPSNKKSPVTKLTLNRCLSSEVDSKHPVS